MLHIAPEQIFIEHFSTNKNIEYLSADVQNQLAMEKMDITDIKYPDDTFDIIFCCHVLEHIPDDIKAMSEMRRTLKQSGWAILQVPINTDKTFENPSIIAPQERERLFGQSDHVRKYGLDYYDRLESVGFTVTRYNAVDIAGKNNIKRMGIMENEEVCYCKKAE